MQTPSLQGTLKNAKHLARSNIAHTLTPVDKNQPPTPSTLDAPAPT